MAQLGEPFLEVKTPDGVVLRRPLAGPGSRAAAGLVDLGVLVVLILILVLSASLAAGLDPTGFGRFVLGLALGGSILVVLGYRFGFELAWAGRTPGKRLLGLRVVASDGRPAGATALLLRTLFWPLDLLPLPVPLGLGVLFASPSHRRIGDYVAGTVVVREPPPPAPEPWPQERWSELPTRSLPLEWGLAARLSAQDQAFLRELLTRASLAPEHRRRLFVEAARHYAARLGLGDFEDARVVLREVYLFTREALAAREAR